MAEATDAARSRVLAARADLCDEVERLEASARAAVDVKAKIRRSPARAAGIAAGAGFIALGGPKRVFRRLRRTVRGPEAEIPSSLLPDQIERTLRKLGGDGDRIRGTLERDFAAYAEEKATKRGPDLGGLIMSLVAKPILTRGGRAAVEWLFDPDEDGFAARLADVRERAGAAKAARDGARGANRPDGGAPAA